MKEATSRIKINKLLEAAGWRFFPEDKLPANIQLEPKVTIKIAELDALGNDFEKTAKSFIDFLLLDSRGFPLIVHRCRLHLRRRDPTHLGRWCKLARSLDTHRFFRFGKVLGQQ